MRINEIAQNNIQSQDNSETKNNTMRIDFRTLIKRGIL